MELGLCKTDTGFQAYTDFEKKKKKSVGDWQGWIAELIGHMCGFMGVKEEGMKKKKTETTPLPVMQNMNLSGRYWSLFVFQLMTAPG